jgi:hypothetical protein
LEHIGEKNCVSSKSISEYLGDCGYVVKTDSVHGLVRKIMMSRTLPICHVNGKGYFWAETKEEIQASINDIEGRISEMQNRVKILKKFIVN